MAGEDRSLFLTSFINFEEVPDGSVAYHVIEQQSKLFISSWQVDRNMSLLCHSLFYVGPAEEARNYSYELGITKWNVIGFKPITVKWPCYPIKDILVRNEDCEDVVPIHYELVKRWFQPNGLEFNINIHHTARDHET